MAMNNNSFDPTHNISWQLGHRGRVAVFIDGNNLFHAARFHNIDIDYNKLLRVLLGDGRLLRAFFYTGVDVGAERQQGFLLWMRRNGFRVIQKELKTFYDGSRKANLDVEIAVDMLSLAGRYDTAVLDSGEIADRVRKEVVHGARYDEPGVPEQQPTQYLEQIHIQETNEDGFQSAMHVVVETTIEPDAAEFTDAAEFIRVTDEQ